MFVSLIFIRYFIILSSLAIHFSILENSVAITSELYFLSCLMICFSRNLIGLLTDVSSLVETQSFVTMSNATRSAIC